MKNMNSVVVIALLIMKVLGHRQQVPQGEERTFDHYIREDKNHLTEDIKEQLHVEIDPTKMTEEEAQFYYFSLHDHDQDNKLDGLEVLLALNHDVTDPKSKPTPSPSPAGHLSESDKYNQKLLQEEANKRFEEDSKLVDDIMSSYDWNNDGYIEYDEYVYGRKKEMEKYGH